MKKLTILFLSMLALTLTGCEDNRTREQIDTGIASQSIASQSIASQITEFNYKGHKYLLYRQVGGYGGIAHDPDCPCHKKGGSEHGEY